MPPEAKPTLLRAATEAGAGFISIVLEDLRRLTRRFMSAELQLDFADYTLELLTNQLPVLTIDCRLNGGALAGACVGAWR